MNPPKRGTPDFLLLFLTIALVAFGLIMVFSASSMTSAYQNGDPLYYTKRQGIFIVLGMIGMFFFMNVPYAKLRKLTAPMFSAIVLLLMLVTMVGTGPEGSGIHSWFRFGSFSVQPAEFAKLVVILYLASLVSKKGERMAEFKTGLLPALVIVCIVAGLIMTQPDLGTCLVLVASSGVVIWVGGARLLHLAGLAFVGLGLLALAVSVASYRLARFTTFLNPLEDTQDKGYQLARSLYAFGHGGITGAGFGQSILKLQFLPEAHNDFIFAIIGEEFGLVGSALFIIVFSLFVWRGIIIALRCQDPFGMLTGIGIVGMFGIQAMVNIGGVTASIPLTGVTLPFISYGGSSILVCLASIGLLLGISREQNKPDSEKKEKRLRRA